MTRNRILLVTTLMCLGVAVAACEKGNERANQDQNPNNPNNVNQPDNRRGMTNPQDNRPAETTADNRGPDQAQKQQITARVDQEKKDYHAKVDAELKDVDSRYDAMKDAVDKLSKGPSKDADQKLLDDLKDRRQTLKSDRSDIDSAKETEWPAVKTKVDGDLDAFRRSLQAATARIHVTPPRGAAPPSGVTHPQPGTTQTHPYDTNHKNQHENENR